MGENPFADQLQKNIQNLLAEKKFKDAYELCDKAIEKYPEEKELRKLKTFIEDKIREGNLKYIEAELQKLDSLWEKNAYPEILRKLFSLLELDKTNEKLKRLYKKAEDAYKDEIDNFQKKYVKSESEKLDKLFKEDENKLIETLLELEKNNRGNTVINTLVKDYKNKVIKRKIEEKQDLIFSDKYEDIQNFVIQLKKIDGDNPEISKLEHSINSRKLGNQIDNKNEFIFEGQGNLNTLMKLKKYDKAIQVASEILQMDPKNAFASKVLEQAKRKFYGQTKNASIDVIKKDSGKLKEEYSKNPSQFVKL